MGIWYGLDLELIGHSQMKNNNAAFFVGVADALYGPNDRPERIRALRVNANLTQSQAAKLVNVQQNTWYRWEAGINQMPTALFELFLYKLGMER